MPKPLPTTTASFRKIIEGQFLYIDKTKPIYQIAQRATGAWFLARPRRFGKSLFLSTLEELFRSNRPLFHGLWIDQSDYDWAVHPVIRLDFNLYPSTTAEELKGNIKRYLASNAARYGITLPDGPYYAQFGDLITTLAAEKQVIFKFKLDKSDKVALRQMKTHAYYQKYQLHGKPITCIGVNFNTKTRTVGIGNQQRLQPDKDCDSH
jgi:Predicted AAA-ATPase/PD-(D/E)XK nuclease superfamily